MDTNGTPCSLIILQTRKIVTNKLLSIIVLYCNSVAIGCRNSVRFHRSFYSVELIIVECFTYLIEFSILFIVPSKFRVKSKSIFP